MGRAEPQWRAALPIAFALTLPVGPFATVPLLNIPLAGLLLLCMGALSPFLWRRERPLRPPFEYWWPAPILLAVAIAAAMGGETPRALYLVQAAIAFLAPLALAANGTVACRAFTAFGASAGLLALMQWGAGRLWLPPTAIHPPADLLLAGPDSLTSAILLAATGAAVNLVVLAHPRFTPMQRRLALPALAALAIWLLCLLPHGGGALAGAGAPILANPTGLLCALLALWLAARIAARALLFALRKGEARLAAIPVAMAAVLGFHLAAAQAPHYSAFFLLGLAAALDTPWTRHRAVPIAHYVWAIPAACILLQLSGLPPLAAADPRNQVARAEGLLAAKAWQELDAELACLVRRRPGHPDFTLLQARSLLAQGWPNAAVEAYCRAPRPKAGATPFQERHGRVFLDALRDAASAQERGRAHFDFERALVHHDELDQARNLLQIRRGSARVTQGPAGDRAALEWGLQTLVGAPEGELHLADWEPEALRAVLADGGVEIRDFPAGFDPEAPPLLLWAALRPAGVMVQTSRSGDARPTEVYKAAMRALSDAPPSLAWGDWSQVPEGGWTIGLAVSGTPLLRVHAGGDRPPEFLRADLPGNAESTAALLCLP